MFTRWKFLKDQKMSFKEIKDEYKNTEGDPHVKAALREANADDAKNHALKLFRLQILLQQTLFTLL